MVVVGSLVLSPPRFRVAEPTTTLILTTQGTLPETNANPTLPVITKSIPPLAPFRVPLQGVKKRLQKREGWLQDITMLKIWVSFFAVVVSTAFMLGCASTHSSSVDRAMGGGDNFSLGKVQREIKIGMTTAEVVSALGSPNIVTTDAERREQWVYDKVASDVAYSSGGVSLIFAGASGGKRSSSQRTLTVVIKFDNEAKVRDFAYHNSKF
jgi:outer membrane protein assembly factor BamE (lipoprotein component of BamABCDE complex)